MKKIQQQLSLKEQFRLWLETEQKIDEILTIVKISCILSKLDSKLAIVRGNRLEKRYLYKWIKYFRIDRSINNIF
jgi:hypothetical protein